MLLTVLLTCLHATADDDVVHLVTTGATGGIGSGQWSLSLPADFRPSAPFDPCVPSTGR